MRLQRDGGGLRPAISARLMNRKVGLVYLIHSCTCGEPVEKSKLVIVVHYHELWLKGGNRRFFLSKLHVALKRALEGLPVERILRPGDRLLVEFGEGASAEEAVARIERVFGVAFYAVARVVPRGSEDDREALGTAAWDEIRREQFGTFAVRAKRSDKSFPQSTIGIEVSVGQYLVDRLSATGRDARVKLNDPDLTCRIEIPPGPSLLVYARKIPGAGGLPANTAGRMTCLLSGGFDSAVAAHKMMKRGAHLNFVHFWGGGARPGESSVHLSRELVKRLVPWQFSAKLYLVPFEPVQREIVARADSSPATAWPRWLLKHCTIWPRWDLSCECRFIVHWSATTKSKSWMPRE